MTRTARQKEAIRNLAKALDACAAVGVILESDHGPRAFLITTHPRNRPITPEDEPRMLTSDHLRDLLKPIDYGRPSIREKEDR